MTLLTKQMLSDLVGKVIAFTPDIENWEMYAEPGMKARVRKVEWDVHSNPHDIPEDVCHRLYVDFDEFEETNHPLQVANYYNNKGGDELLTAVEAGFYEPKDWIYVGAKEEDLPFKVIEDAPSEIMELRLCEVAHTCLKPNQKYIFTVDPDCEGCRKAEKAAMGG